MSVNILGWEAWTVSDSQVKGRDYRIVAEYEGRPMSCPKCGTDSPKVTSRGWREIRLRDTLIHGHRVGIIARVRQWTCGECGETFTHRPPELAEKRGLTARLLETLQRESFERPFQELADRYGVSEARVREVFREEAARHEAEREVEPPKILGVDEVHIGGRRFVAANLGAKPAALIDMLVDRHRPTVEGLLSSPGWAKSVEIVAMDMWNPYRLAVRRVIPRARIVVDKFHVLMMANRIVDRIRDGVVRYGSAADRKSLKGSRRIVRSRGHALDKDGREALERWRGLYPDLVKAYELKEALHEVYGAGDRADGGARLGAWLRTIPAGLQPDFRELMLAVRSWRKEILNYFDTRVTNAATERLNRYIRLVNELGNGYSFAALRAKMLYATPQVPTKYWGGAGPARPIAGSMGFSVHGGGGREGMAGTDLDWLISTMEGRQGRWQDAELWR